MPWTVASDDSAPSMRPTTTRVAGVESAREIKSARTLFSSSAARPVETTSAPAAVAAATAPMMNDARRRTIRRTVRC